MIELTNKQFVKLISLIDHQGYSDYKIRLCPQGDDVKGDAKILYIIEEGRSMYCYEWTDYGRWNFLREYNVI